MGEMIERWIDVPARGDTGTYTPPAETEEATAFTEEGLDDLARQAEALGIRNAKALLRGALARPSIDPGGPQRNSESPRIAPEPSESDELAEESVGTSDEISAARDRMVQRGKQAWKTGKKWDRKSTGSPNSMRRPAPIAASEVAQGKVPDWAWNYVEPGTTAWQALKNGAYSSAIGTEGDKGLPLVKNNPSPPAPAPIMGSTRQRMAPRDEDGSTGPSTTTGDYEAAVGGPDALSEARDSMVARNKDAWKTGKKWDRYRGRNAR